MKPTDMPRKRPHWQYRVVKGFENKPVIPAQKQAQLERELKDNDEQAEQQR